MTKQHTALINTVFCVLCFPGSNFSLFIFQPKTHKKNISKTRKCLLCDYFLHKLLLNVAIIQSKFMSSLEYHL